MLKKLLLCIAAMCFMATAAFAATDVNTANQTELEKLPGIGPAKAKAIVEYRQKNGPFKSADDLKNVNGIGDKTLAELKSQISVGGGKSDAKPAEKAADKPAEKAKK